MIQKVKGHNRATNDSSKITYKYINRTEFKNKRREREQLVPDPWYGRRKREGRKEGSC